jgi:hypothetical protein
MFSPGLGEEKMNVDPLLSRLSNVRPGRQGWSARCPAHDDRHNSLSIAERAGRVLLHCHAGCRPEAVLRAVGLTWRHLSAGPPTGTPPSPLAWLADYCQVPADFLTTLPLGEEGDGVVFRFGAGLATKHRRAGTKEIFWRPAGAPTPPLWPLPETPTDTLWLTEGETDAIVLRYLAFDAHALTKGAEGGVKPAEALALAQQGVQRAFILFDADEAGRRGAERLAHTLAAAGVEAHPVDLLAAGMVDPLKGQKDLRDGWRTAADKAEFGRQVERAAKATPKVSPSEIHNSHPLRSVNCEFVKVGERPEPPPRPWLLPGFVPERALSIWYGDAGAYKSYLACYLATVLCQCVPFLGLDVLGCPVLYVDTELDEDEFVRRAYAIARGLGLSRPPQELYYYRLARSLADDETLTEMGALRLSLGVGLVIVDSLTLGAFGANVSDIDVATKILNNLKPLGTVLAIDHIPRPLPGANLSAYRPFGSMAKWAEGRCITQILKAEGEGIVLRPAKSNFGRLGAPLGARVTFADGAVTFTPTDVAALGAEDHLPAVERVYVALAQRGEEGATPGELADELELSEGRVRNYLTTLRQQGRAETERGRWRALHTSQFTPLKGL